MRLSARRLSLFAAALMCSSGAMLGGAADAAASCLGTARTIQLDPANGNFYNGLEKSLGLRDGEVVLTFDDGPIPGVTPRILDALRDECTRATFFMAGRMAENYSNIAQRVRREGHTLANHTYAHENLAKSSSAKVSDTLNRGAASIKRATGASDLSFFRYPYLAKSKRTDEIIRSRGMIAFGANIDSKDYKKVSPGTVHDTIISKLRKQRKGIVLMHDIQNRTATMLPRLLDTLKAEGFRVVHIVPGRGDAVADGTVLASVAPKAKAKQGRLVLASTASAYVAAPRLSDLPLPLDLLAEKGRGDEIKAVPTPVAEKLRNRFRVRDKFRIAATMPLGPDGVPLLTLEKK